MYDHIAGEVTEVQPARVVVRAGGVGYELKVPVSTSERLRAGSTEVLRTILHVQDGMPTLLGFARDEERSLARLLLSVSGVGPSMALGILSTFAPAEVAAAIASDDAATLKRVKGVGAKTAERICLELRDKVSRLELGGGATAPASAPLSDAAGDAVMALVTLGYSEKDASGRVGKALAKAPDSSTEDLIKVVLRG